MGWKKVIDEGKDGEVIFEARRNNVFAGRLGVGQSPFSKTWGVDFLKSIYTPHLLIKNRIKSKNEALKVAKRWMKAHPNG